MYACQHYNTLQMNRSDFLLLHPRPCMWTIQHKAQGFANRVQASGGTLRRGIVAFQVDGKISARAGHGALPPFSEFTR